MGPHGHWSSNRPQHSLPRVVTYPSTTADRARFILERRGTKNGLDSIRACGAFVEEEPTSCGIAVPVATILLTNRECPWKCVFCDLWTNTLDETVPSGAISQQIRAALADLSPARWIKLYNAGSFFDPRAIPPGDIPAIADLLAPFERVIVESHPALIDGGVGSRVLYFRDLLRARSIDTPRSIDAHRSSDSSPANNPRSTDESTSPTMRARGWRDGYDQSSPTSDSAPTNDLPLTIDPPRHPLSKSPKHPPSPRLEVAMGLETVHPLALERMNKGMTLDDFARAADVLRRADIDLRAFVLVQPPFTPPEEAVHWALRSLDFAQDHGARLVAFIPTRGGNGAMEALAASGDFTPPRLPTLEEVLGRALESVSSRGGPVVVADLWDLQVFSDCRACFPARAARLRRMNLSQRVEPRIPCDCASSRAPGSRITGESCLR